MSEQSQFAWHDPDWKRQVHDWIGAEAKHNSILLIGEIKQPHVYHWSTVMRIPSSEGTLFFKATAGETVHSCRICLDHP